LLGTAVRILAERDDLQTRLRDDPSLIPSFVEEALRYDPPFRGHYRIVTGDTTLAGTAIPAGAHVVLLWPAGNRDEQVYDEPDEVRLDRPNARNHVGFGWGIHLCIGAPLARLETRVALEELLGATVRFGIDSEALTPAYHASLLVRRLESLPLVLEQEVAAARK
jgi:cytochrome P450